MAKPKKYPKSPKATASLEVWARHKEKIKEVDKANAQMKADKLKRKRVQDEVRKMKSKR